MPTELERKIATARNNAIKKYSPLHVNVGDRYHLETVPTGSTMLNYKLRTKGFPYGHCVEVFGANKIGKSSALGYPTLGNVQKQGRLPALIAVEPRFTTPEDREWGLRMGVNPDLLHIQYPDNAEEAFDMLRDMVFENIVDYIMIDSLGGMGSASGAQQDGKKKAYGVSGVVTAGLNDIMPRLWKNNIGLLIINQQRQAGTVGKSNITVYDSPGGEGLKHHARIRIHVKPGSTRYHAVIDEENVMVGRELVCSIIKNNMAQASERAAKFDFFFAETEQYGLGIDATQDILNVGTITGVIEKSGAFYKHSCFPKSLQGKEKVKEHFREHPDHLVIIQQEIMKIADAKEAEVRKDQDV